MGTKTITITNEAYEKLAHLKIERESFSEVINRITSKNSIAELIGLLSNNEAEELKGYIKNTRKRMRKRMEEISVKLQ